MHGPARIGHRRVRGVGDPVAGGRPVGDGARLHHRLEQPRVGGTVRDHDHGGAVACRMGGAVDDRREAVRERNERDTGRIDELGGDGGHHAGSRRAHGLDDGEAACAQGVENGGWSAR